MRSEPASEGFVLNDNALEPALEIVRPLESGGLLMRDFHRSMRSHAGDEEEVHSGLDPAYEGQEGVREALAAVRAACPIIFVSGRAGTGKSRFINYLRSMPGGTRQVVVAPTGIAAMALRAATIHSFFRLPIGVIDPDALTEDDRVGKVHRRMRRLVIDEISMVRADVLDAIDRRLRQAQDPDLPFGGVQVVMVGDFLQLPPVVTDADRALLERLGYETPFAFSARIMQDTPIQVATLKKVWRQADPDMIAALGSIREGRNADAAVAWLNRHCARDHRPGVEPLLLTATRSAADAYNEAGLEALRARFGGIRGFQAIFRAVVLGAYENERAALPATRDLELFPGTRVMAVRNDALGEYANGSLGVVMDFSDGGGVLDEAWVDVLFDGKERPTRIAAATWTKTQQQWSEIDDAIVETVVGTFQQIPLMVAYAITIHKSQGMSLEDVRIDLGRGAFAPGQLYVALSRARSVEGLSFAREITASDVQVDEMLIRFSEWARRASNLAFPVAKDRQSDRS